MEGLELVSFKIIASVGSARSYYIDAIHAAKLGHFEEAEKLVEEGNKVFIEGHQAHADIIQQEANGKRCEFQLLFMHAEDQLMSAEAFGILAGEFIDVYKKITKK